MITIERIAVKNMGSCNACRRGELKEDGIGLIYPYEHVYELRIGQPDFSQSIRLCSECIEELKCVI